MAVLNIVMGVSRSGRTHFIEEHFKDYKHYSVGDYQRQLKMEAGNPDKLSFFEYKQLLMKANEQIKEDVKQALQEGHNVALEHTLFKAKRRITYIEELKQVADIQINIYVIMPTDEQFRYNLEHSAKHDVSDFYSLKKEMDEIEFPNIAEGYDKIFVVRDSELEEIKSEADYEIVHRAKAELIAEEIAEEKIEENEKKHEEFFRSLNENGFWHYCEVCGKKEFLTPEQAFENGWDYPPRMGVFGVIAPRTCGECSITDTVWWKIAVDKELNLDDLTDREKNVVGRILAEPYSLLKEE